jgi:hypothetical protein
MLVARVCPAGAASEAVASPQGETDEGEGPREPAVAAVAGAYERRSGMSRSRSSAPASSTGSGREKW